MQHRWENKDQTQLDCESCKARLSPAERSRMGCAYVPGATSPRGVLGCPVSPSVCAGYSIRLPVVHEVASCHTHWDKGHLRERLGDDTPTPALMALIETYDAARRGAESYFMRPKEDR